MWYIYTMEYFSAIKKNEFESVSVRYMNCEVEAVTQSEVSYIYKKTYIAY